PNPIGRRFTTRTQAARFLMRDARTIEPAGGPGGRFHVTGLLAATPPTWQEDNLNAVPSAALEQLTRYLETRNIEELRRKGVGRALRYVGVMVPEEPPNPQRFHGTQLPRLVVVGSSSWISDQSIATGQNAELFTACVAWLLQRPDITPSTESGT